jgi:Protein of unknown function (DUF3108)
MLKPLLPLTLALALPLAAQAADPRPYSGIYQTKYGLLSATGERRLDALPDGRWKLENHARLMMVDVAEISTFTLQDGKVNSLTYEFVNPLSKDRSVSLVFDWSQHVAIDKDHKDKVAITPGVFDKLGYQVQMQMDVCANPDAFPGENFTVVDRGRLKTYRVELVGREPLKTAAGTLNTIHLRQFRPDKRDGKDTMIWLAADWNCLLVRLDQHEGDDIVSLTLVKATVAGVKVIGTP